MLGSHDDSSLLCMEDGAYLYKDHAVVSEKRLYKIKEMGHKLFSLDEEGLIYISKEAYRKNRVSRDWAEKAEVLFCWGGAQEKLIKEKCPNAHCIPVGNPRLDLLHYVRERKAGRRISDKLNILINTRFTSINSPGGEFDFISRLQSLGLIRNDVDKEYFENHQKNDRLIFSEFKNLIESVSEISGCNVVIRPHPAESNDKYKAMFSDFDVEIDDGKELIKQLEWADVLIHDGCTTAIEGMLSGTTVIGLRPSDVSYSYGELANNFSHASFFDYKSLASYIESMVKDKDHRKGRAIQNLDCIKVAGKQVAITEMIDSWDRPHAATKILQHISSVEVPLQPLVSKNSRANIKECIKLAAFQLIKRGSNLIPFDLTANRLKNFVRDKEVSLTKFKLTESEEVKGDIEYLAGLLGLGYSEFHVKKLSGRSFLIYCE